MLAAAFSAHSIFRTSRKINTGLRFKMSGLPFDRKAMEQERLARQAARQKRERSISPPPVNSSRKAPRLQETTTTFASGAKLNFIFTPTTEPASEPPAKPIKSEAKSEVKAEAKRTPALQSMSLKYPNGAVKRTWAFGHDRDNDIKIEEVLEPLTLNTAVLSSFQWQADWVFSKLKTPLRGGKTKCIFIMEGKTPEACKTMLEETSHMRSFLELCFPPMEYASCMHSKLMLLFHPDKMRIAVPTANLLDFDWGETGVMENSVFLIDLPRLPESVKRNAEELTEFGKDLLFFLKKQNVGENVQRGILNFDFAATVNMAFVHSVGGTLFREEAERTGLAGLSRAVRSLHMTSKPDLELDFAASSIGSLKESYLQNFYAAACGIDLIKHPVSAANKKDFFKKSSEKSPVAKANVKDKLRVYYPTHDTVKASKTGSAGTIWLHRKWFEASGFPKEIFRDYVSTRPGLLSHNKILCARGTSAEEGDAPHKHVAWVYVGSANMSMSAWGTVSKDAKTAKGKTTCRNWECGVILHVPVKDELTTSQVIIKTENINEGQEVDTKVVIKEEPADEGSETESDEDFPNASSSKVKREVDSDAETVDDGGSQSPDGGHETKTQHQRSAAGARTLPARKAPPASAQPAIVRPLPGMEVFKRVIDLPFIVPGAEYNGRDPWYYNESIQGRQDANEEF